RSVQLDDHRPKPVKVDAESFRHRFHDHTISIAFDQDYKPRGQSLKKSRRPPVRTHLLNLRQFGLPDLSAFPMAIDSNDFGGFEAMEDIRRVGDDDLLITITTQEIRCRPLAGRM